MTRQLENRIAVVTGASRGIGKYVALALAAEGAHVIALARTQGGLEELDDEIKAVGGSATLVPADVTDYPALDRLGAAIHERWGRLDILIGNAGVLGKLSPLGHIEPKIWDEVMAQPPAPAPQKPTEPENLNPTTEIGAAYRTHQAAHHLLSASSERVFREFHYFEN